MNLNQTILDNTVRDYLIVVGVMMVTLMVNKYLSASINRLIYAVFRKLSDENRFRDFQVYVLNSMQWLLVLLVLVFAVEKLHFPKAWNITLFGTTLFRIVHTIKWVVVLTAFLQVLLNINRFVSTVMMERARQHGWKTQEQLIPFFRDITRVAVFLLYFLILLGVVFKLNITSVLAGLGIGGLAVAFAAQESIKDLFGSITIFFDKPFSVGDIVNINGVEGTVEAIGFRSTRIRTYDQTFVTVPNKRMIEANVDNLSQRDRRRARTLLRLSFQSPPETLQSLVADLRRYFETHEHFGQYPCFISVDDFSEYGIVVKIVYFIPVLDPDRHDQLKGEANLKILELVAAHRLRFAERSWSDNV
ncbi:MAG: mechanosensitive ion channel family protein [Chitinophagales bacterium]|nr:mechanosensitive ion channel family protein [Chitinophagales bacterium]MDW8427945.1 mechanosensitive ion channel family protein [Chitinophagales bacterium]